MESQSMDLPREEKTPDVQPSAPANHGQGNSKSSSSSAASASSLSSEAKSVKVSQPSAEESRSWNTARSSFARFTTGFGFQRPTAAPAPDGGVSGSTEQGGVLGTFTKGIVDSSRGAVKAVQVKARHMVSQNKRRYQDGGFDLDMTYITDNIIAMGFPAGDMSSGIFGYIEGFYRNHIEEVIKFFETYHQGKYKVYNLCSERLYDASLFQGKAACFPFDDHNCPPIHLMLSFCQSAYTWLKEDIDNVVVVHCKAGLGRTGLMISSLLLYLKFCTTADESIDCFNKKRCVDEKGLVLPSQIRYVKYFEHILKDYDGNNPPARRCMLRGFRLHKCPYWIRPSITISSHNGILFTTKKHPKTKDLMPEDFWISSSKKRLAVFALPGEPGVAEVTGDFKIHFHDRNGDFYCWLNTTMTDNRIFINSDDLDGFDKRKLPSPPFQLEIVTIDYDGTIPERANTKKAQKNRDGSTNQSSTGDNGVDNKDGSSKKEDNDDVFSDSDVEEGESSKTSEAQSSDNNVANLTQKTEQMSTEPTQKKSGNSVLDGETKSRAAIESPKLGSSTVTDFKAIAADASVFSFGDDEDYDTE